MFGSMRRAYRAAPRGSHFSLGALADPGHLTTEAAAAYADGELRMDAHLRAAGHIAGCRQCAVEVGEQESARRTLRASPAPQAPATLLADLAAIPRNAGRGPGAAPRQDGF